MTQFIHMRYTTEVMTSIGPVREIDGRGGLTIAYELDPETSELHIGYAKCSRLDLYNKKRGRAIAEGRLKSHNWRHTVKFPDVSVFNELSLDRRNVQSYVFGAMVDILPEEAMADYHELVSR